MLQRVSTLVASRGAENHKYYQKLWKLMEDEDEQIALMFDDFKRSNAVFKLAIWRKNGVLSGQLFDNLTEETRVRILAYNGL